ncbi:MAG TPA: cytosine permease, partial [Tepidisphaeraceae bacterium]
HAGTKYGIPFPVYCRASFGTWGANLPAMIRALVGCGWFGIQCWVGGQALLAIAVIFKPEWGGDGWNHLFYDYGVNGVRGPTLPQLYAYGVFWLLNLIVIFAGINTIRWLLNIKAPLLILLGLALLVWAYVKADGFGDLLHSQSAFGPNWASNSNFWTTFGLGLSGMVGFWATLSLNIPDFSRYARSQRDQVIGQALGLPTTMALFAFISVAVTSATVVIFNGNMIDDPVKLVETFKSPWALGLSMAAIALATLATNIAANVVSPANDFAHLAPRFIGFRLGGLITGIVGTLMMPWYLLANADVYINTWLVGISALLGAVGGILVCDYWLVRRAKLSLTDLYRRDGRYSYDRGINWSALLAGAIAIAACVPGFADQASGGRVLAVEYTAGFVFKQLYNYGVFTTFGLAFAAYAIFMGGHPNVRQPVELTMQEFTAETSTDINASPRVLPHAV